MGCFVTCWLMSCFFGHSSHALDLKQNLHVLLLWTLYSTHAHALDTLSMLLFWTLFPCSCFEHSPHTSSVYVALAGRINVDLNVDQGIELKT